MLGKGPRFLLSEDRNQRVTLLLGARVARDKEGCLRGGGTRVNASHLPLPLPSWLGSPVRSRLWPMPQLQCCRRVPRHPPTLFPTTKPHAMGATGVGGGDWERKKGGREKGRPCEGTKPLWEEHFSGHTTKQNNQTACAPVCQAAGHLCVGQGHLNVGRAGRREGDSHLLSELLRVAVFPSLAIPSPSDAWIEGTAIHSQGGGIM